jgi:uroporphyrinogen-III synthase
VHYLPIEPLTITPQAIILTSANSALALQHSDWDRTIPVYGVGTATASEAKSVGFLDCSSPSDKPYPSALNLISWIKKNLIPADGPLVFGCGNIIRHDIREALKPFGFITLKVALYEAKAITTFDKKIEMALKNHTINSVMISSEQALQTFAALCNQSDISHHMFAILVPSEFLKTTAGQMGYTNISILQKKQ